MFDAKRLLGQFIAGRVAKTMGGGGFGGGSGGPFGTPGGSGFGGGGSPFDLARTLGGGSGGALAGGLASVLLGSKKGRRLGGSAARMGGMALIGSLAFKAFQAWQANQASRPSTDRSGFGSFGGAFGSPAGFGGFGQPSGAGSFLDTAGSPWGGARPASAAPLDEPPAGSAFAPAGEHAEQDLSRKLLRAMIAAAKADGHIDATEQAAIFGEMDKLDLDPDDKAFVVDELRAPLDVDAVARSAANPEEATAIYTASLLAIDVDNAAERGYLAMLAARLKLDDALVQHLHATVEEEAAAA